MNGQAGWYTNFVFVPATRDGSAPYGTWTWNGKATTSNEWYSGGGTVPNLASFGIIMLNLNSAGWRIGSVVGWLGWGSNLLSGNNILHQVGYATNLDSSNKMHSVYTTVFRTLSLSNAEVASPMLGAVGPPLIQNFGFNSVGEPAGTYRTARNAVVGVTSYYYTSTTLACGTSTIGASSSFASMMTTACAWAANNCV